MRNKGNTTEQNRRRRERAFEYVNHLKNNPCVDCGGIFHPQAMDFDHVGDSEKYRDVSFLADHGYSLDTIQAEIDKCELVCANCHRLRTYYRRLAS